MLASEISWDVNKTSWGVFDFIFCGLDYLLVSFLKLSMAFFENVRIEKNLNPFNNISYVYILKLDHFLFSGKLYN